MGGLSNLNSLVFFAALIVIEFAYSVTRVGNVSGQQ